MNASQFSMWSHDVVAQSINLATDLKTGQVCFGSLTSSCPGSCSTGSTLRFLQEVCMAHLTMLMLLTSAVVVMFAIQIWGTILGEKPSAGCSLNLTLLSRRHRQLR
jgi:hypothetical protein